MDEATTTETSDATPKAVAPRRLHPGLAFLSGLVGLGLGYVYVGRIAYAIAFVVAAYLCHLNLEASGSLPDYSPLTLGADEFFVLGDFRGISNDSRQNGPLARDQIYGRVEFVAYSRSRDRFALVLAPD